MSTTIEERIVGMKFDNKQFEQSASTTIKTLDKLTSSTDNLSNINNIGKKFSLGGIASAVDSISERFSALGIIGMTALQNITNSAINTGKRMISALTIDPIRTGFQEYETKMGSIQTILTNTASKGTKLEDVNKALNELNKYADLTIYNFAEMTRNIGTFTAAGVDLDTSVKSIKGIANLAAGSGSTAVQASTAMYQLSQAIAAGSVKLQDWNSVVNAGMGGELFQNALKESAKEMGIFVDSSVPFRESLQEGWLTTDVLTKTLEKFSEDESLVKAATQVKTFTQLFDTMKESVQSGWAESWENIIGDKEQSTKTLTAISDAFNAIIEPSSEARNTALAFWNANDGRDTMIKAISNAFEALQAIIRPVGEAFKEVFPAITGQRLVEISKNMLKLTENFKIGEKTTNNIKRTFKGFFALLDIGGKVITGLVKGFGTILGFAMPISGGILGITAAIGDFIVGINDAIKSTDGFQKVLMSIGEFFSPLIDMIKGLLSTISESFGAFPKIDMSGISAFVASVKEKLEPLNKVGDFLKGIFNGIVSIAKGFIEVSKKIVVAIGNVLSSIKDKIVSGWENLDINTIFDLINAGLVAGIIVLVKNIISGINNAIGNFMDIIGLKNFIGSLGDTFGGITDILDGVKDSLKTWQTSLKADILIKIAAALAILTASLTVLSLLDADKLVSSLATMGAMFAQLMGTLAIFQKIADGKNLDGVTKTTFALLGLSTSVLILSSAMAKFQTLKWSEIIKGLVSISTLSLVLAKSAEVMSRSTGKMAVSAIGLIGFAASIHILVAAVEKLGNIDVVSLQKGLLSLGIIFAEFALFLRFSNIDKGLTKKISVIAKLSVALLILSEAVREFGSMNPDTIVQGLAAVGVVMAELAIFSKLIAGTKKISQISIGLTILSGAMLVFAEAIKRMGNLSGEQIAKGLISMAAALTIITVALRMLPTDTLIKSIGLLGISAALLVLSNALKTMGGMSPEQIGKSLIVLAGALAVIAVAMTLMTSALPGAAALLVIVGALALFTPVLERLGNLSLAEIGKGLLALVGLFTVLGVAGLLLAPLTPILIALGAAIAIFGVGVLAISTGMLAFATALTMLAAAGPKAADALKMVMSTIIESIPAILEQFARGMISFAQVIVDGGPTVVAAIVTVLTGMMDAVAQTIPKFVETAVLLISSFLKTLADNVPNIIQSGMQLIIGFLTGIANNIQQIVVTAIQIVTEFINGVSSQIPNIIDAGFNLVISFINGLATAIRENSATLTNAMINLAEAMIQGLVNGLTAGIKTVGNAAIELGKSALNSVKNFLGIHSPSREFEALGMYTGQGFAQGVGENNTAIITAMKTMSQQAIAAIETFMPQFIDGGARAIGAIVTGMNNKIPDAQFAARTLAERVLGELSSKNYQFVDIGRSMVAGFVNGIRSQINAAAQAAAEMARAASEAAKRELNIHSPSRVFEGLGVFSVRGFVNGFLNSMSSVRSAGVKMGEESINGVKDSLYRLSNILENDTDFSPVITPVLDLNDVSNGLDKMDGMFQKTRNIAIPKATKMITHNVETNDPKFKPRNPNSPGTAPISFVQNNYSPKALSRIEIYRQTKNQFSAIKEVVDSK